MLVTGTAQSAEQCSHYPDNTADAWELYNDLREYGGLTHEEAVETLGYAVQVDAANCPSIEPMGEIFWHWHVMPDFKREEDKVLYANGIAIAEQELLVEPLEPISWHADQTSDGAQNG